MTSLLVGRQTRVHSLAKQLIRKHLVHGNIDRRTMKILLQMECYSQDESGSLLKWFAYMTITHMTKIQCYGGRMVPL